MNKIILSGRTTSDPSLKFLGTGTAICNLTLAVRRSRKNAQGEYESDFINCQAWAKTGEIIADYVKKGQLLTVSGRLQIRKYEKDGVNHWASEVVIEDFDFPQKDKGQSEANQSPFGREVNLEEDPFA